MKTFWLFGLAALLTAPAHALILTGSGNTPVTDRNWPTGSVDVANITNRTGWWEGPPFGGGEWHFNYVGDMEAFQHTLDLFAKIKAPALDLYVHDGGKPSFIGNSNEKTGTNNINWSFMVWDRESWNRMYGGGRVMLTDDPNAGKTLPPARIDLHLPPNGPVAFNKLVIATNITLHDERAVAAGVDVSGGTVFIATITDANTHLPMPGALLIVRERDEKVTTNVVTDQQGMARVDNLPPGGYQLSARADGYVETSAGWFDLSSPAYKKVGAALARAGSLTGKVVDEKGNGVPGMNLYAMNTLLEGNVPYRPLNKSDATTDSDGRFILRDLPVGSAQLWLRSTNYFATNMFDYHSVPGAEAIIHVKSTGTLRVQVRDAAGNDTTASIGVAPIEGSGRGKWGASANLPAEGMVFNAVHPGTYFVTVNNTGIKETVTVRPNQMTEVIIELPPAPEPAKKRK
jgi:hypothetical protein